jgi:hypothetical protein
MFTRLSAASFQGPCPRMFTTVLQRRYGTVKASGFVVDDNNSLPGLQRSRHHRHRTRDGSSSVCETAGMHKSPRQLIRNIDSTVPVEVVLSVGGKGIFCCTTHIMLKTVRLS